MIESRWISVRSILAALALLVLCGVALTLKRRPAAHAQSQASRGGQFNHGLQQRALDSRGGRTRTEVARLPFARRVVTPPSRPIDTRYRGISAPQPVVQTPPRAAQPVVHVTAPPATVVNRIDTSGIEDSITGLRRQLSRLAEERDELLTARHRERMDHLEQQIVELRNDRRTADPVHLQLELHSDLPLERVEQTRPRPRPVRTATEVPAQQTALPLLDESQRSAARLAQSAKPMRPSPTSKQRTAQDRAEAVRKYGNPVKRPVRRASSRNDHRFVFVMSGAAPIGQKPDDEQKPVTKQDEESDPPKKPSAKEAEPKKSNPKVTPPRKKTRSQQQRPKRQQQNLTVNRVMPATAHVVTPYNMIPEQNEPYCPVCKQHHRRIGVPLKAGQRLCKHCRNR